MFWKSLEKVGIAAVATVALAYCLGAVDLAGGAGVLGIDFPSMFSYFSVEEILTRGIARLLSLGTLLLVAAIVALSALSQSKWSHKNLSIRWRIVFLVISLLTVFGVFVYGFVADPSQLKATVLLLGVVPLAAFLILVGDLFDRNQRQQWFALAFLVAWLFFTTWSSATPGPIVVIVEKANAGNVNGHKPVFTEGNLVNRDDGYWVVWDANNLVEVPDSSVAYAVTDVPSTSDRLEPLRLSVDRENGIRSEPVPAQGTKWDLRLDKQEIAEARRTIRSLSEGIQVLEKHPGAARNADSLQVLVRSKREAQSLLKEKVANLGVTSLPP